MPTRHYATLWYRDEAGGMHWRCRACGEVLPTLTAPITDEASATWQAASFQACAGDRQLVDTPDQVAYRARHAFTAWIKTLDPETLGQRGLAALIAPNKAYDILSESARVAYAVMGLGAIGQAVGALTAWKRCEMTEGTACKALGMDRVSFRGVCRDLGLVQDDPPPVPTVTPEYPITGPAVLV